MNDKHDEKIKSLENEIAFLHEQLVKAQEEKIKLRKIKELEEQASKLKSALANLVESDLVSSTLNISQYVMFKWDTLPHSTFNDEELVMIKEICNDDQGYGNHTYEGYGVDKEGNLVWAYSSGCSCNGSCETEHKKDAKTFLIDWLDEFTSIDPYTFNFNSVNPVNFSDY